MRDYDWIDPKTEVENMRRVLDPDEIREESTPDEIMNSLYTIEELDKKRINGLGHKGAVDNLKRAIK